MMLSEKGEKKRYILPVSSFEQHSRDTENDNRSSSDNLQLPTIPRQPIIFLRSNLSFESINSDDNEDETSEVQSRRRSLEQETHSVHDRIDEIVIDGVVVEVEAPNKNQIEGYCSRKTSCFYFFTLVLVLIVLFTVINNDNANDSRHFDYEAYAREIAISVSGKEKVDDPNSIHYWAYHVLSKNLPRLLNDTAPTEETHKAITQRYVIGVIMIEGYQEQEYVMSLIEKQRFEHVCDSFLCNENNEIVLHERRNLINTFLRAGILPPEIGNLTSLTHLILTRSAFSGTIPTEVGRLRDLKVLDVSDNFFSGTIPTEIGQLVNLELLIFSSNSFVGSIPTELNNLPNLIAFDVSNNDFTGVIPPLWISNDSLIKLDSRNNSFSGGIESLCSFDLGDKQPYSHVIQNGVIKLSFEIIPGFFVDCVDDQTEQECRYCDYN